MAKFLPVCPKCQSTDTDLYQDRAISARPFPHCAVFHCRCCGNRLMGAGAVDYTNRLMAEYQVVEKAAAEERLLRLEREKALRLEEEIRRVREARAKAEAEAAATQRRKVLPFPGTPLLAACAWKDCDDPTRPKSIYCSRNCSNKNARARHKARLGGTETG